MSKNCTFPQIYDKAKKRCRNPSCGPGMVYDSSKLTCIKRCPTGFEWISTIRACRLKPVPRRSCPIGFTWNDTSNACVQITCPTGQKYDTTKQACVIKPPGCSPSNRWDARLRRCVPRTQVAAPAAAVAAAAYAAPYVAPAVAPPAAVAAPVAAPAVAPTDPAAAPSGEVPMESSGEEEYASEEPAAPAASEGPFGVSWTMWIIGIVCCIVLCCSSGIAVYVMSKGKNGGGGTSPYNIY